MNDNIKFLESISADEFDGDIDDVIETLQEIKNKYRHYHRPYIEFDGADGIVNVYAKKPEWN
ncbi:MAG: hypothetical protein WDA06_08890 [Phenylobacterium sp.]